MLKLNENVVINPGDIVPGQYPGYHPGITTLGIIVDLKINKKEITCIKPDGVVLGPCGLHHTK